jgi:hypothetical protein
LSGGKEAKTLLNLKSAIDFSDASRILLRNLSKTKNKKGVVTVVNSR